MSSGHISRKERNGRVRYYVITESDPDPDGKRIRKSHGGHGRLKDAKADLARVLESQQSGAYIEPSKVTLGGFLVDEWLPGIKSTIRPSTWDSYRRNVECHILPALGNAPLRKLAPAQLNALYSSLAEGDRPLSPRTVRYIHTILRRALKDALRWGKVHRNVADAADPPRTKTPSTRAIWAPEQVRAFLVATETDRLHALYWLALTTGMRRGELLGLRWIDVDLTAARLSIQQTLVTTAGYKVEFGEPKTARSRRTLGLDQATVAELRAHRSRQLEERMAWGPAWTDSGLVFTRENGEFMHPQSASDAFERAVKRAGLPVIRFHDLRHSYATCALEAGMKPWDLSDRLGHASVSFTLQTYRHAVQSTQDSAAEMAAQFILGR